MDVAAVLMKLEGVDRDEPFEQDALQAERNRDTARGSGRLSESQSVHSAGQCRSVCVPCRVAQDPKHAKKLRLRRCQHVPANISVTCIIFVLISYLYLIRNTNTNGASV